MQGKVVIGTELDTKSFDMQIKELEYQLKQIDYELSHSKELKLDDRTISEYEAKAEKLTNQLVSLRQKQEDLNKTDLSGIKSSLDNVGNSMQGIISKVARWGLAVFGIRSAYMFVRQSISTLSQYNEKLATDIEYIRFALATALQPIIETIIKLVYILLQYVNYLAQAWFGVNLFARASTKAFQSGSKALKESNKQAKELQKTLAGFDEMNILQENGNVVSGGGGGGVGGGLPTEDLSKMLENVKIPKWLEKIKDFGLWVLKNWKDVVFLLLTTKTFFDLLTGNWLAVIADLIGLLAIEYAKLMDIKKGLEDLNKIRKQEQKTAEKSKESTQSMINKYNEVSKTTGVTKKQTDDYINTLLNGIKTNNDLINSMEKQKHWYGELTGENEKITNTQKTYNDTIDIQLKELSNLYKQGKLNKEQTAIYTGLLEKQIQKLAIENGSLDKNSDKFKKNTEKIKETKKELETITGKKYEIKTTLKNPDTSSFRKSIDNLIRDIKYMFANVKFAFGIGKIPSYYSGGFRAKGGIYYPSKLPRLAQGGIINNPGQGVAYHGATIGERGAEAVVPLTDSQQMALLGETIGKNVNIVATVPVYVGNRLVAREMKKIEANQNFAMNR